MTFATVGASLTGATAIVAIAGVASVAPLLSIAAYWKLIGPLKFSAGTKYTVAALPVAGTTPFSAIACVRAASLNSAPLAGRLAILNDATVPSMSEPDSDTAIVVSSLPLPEPGFVSGASFTAVMLSDSATVAAEICVVPPVAPVRLSVAPLVMV